MAEAIGNGHANNDSGSTGTESPGGKLHGEHAEERQQDNRHKV